VTTKLCHQVNGKLLLNSDVSHWSTGNVEVSHISDIAVITGKLYKSRHIEYETNLFVSKFINTDEEYFTMLESPHYNYYFPCLNWYTST
jgi:hypothetical protein